MRDLGDYPDWVREVDARLPVSAQLVLAGNCADQHLAPFSPDGEHLGLRGASDILADCLRANGFDVVLGWNAVVGTTVLYEGVPDAARKLLAGDLWEHRGEPCVDHLVALLRVCVPARAARVGLVIENAPRLAPDGEQAELHPLFVAAEYLSRTAPRMRIRPTERAGLFNCVLWLVERESEFPHWIVSAPGVRVVNVPTPTMDTRHRAASLVAPSLPGFADLDVEQRSEVVTELAEQTQGMSLADMIAVVPTALDRTITAAKVADAVRFLRSGVEESPWRQKQTRERIRRANGRLNQIVLGQERAIRKVTDVLARAALGLSGAQSTGHPTRPQGVLFLAGPTGVGKTELAKQLAEIIFGRQDAMVRFDMSEFAAEHNEARLLGAPPGYVGHNAGGELTNAVRRDPFRLLLFDEIEKAHAKILDKFLQILEDGRLTDGSGATVHFTETLIVFTSNLGIYEEDAGTRRRVPLVRPGEPYEHVESVVREAIHTEFTRLNRPELLNRIGDNIVVFDFIDAEIAGTLVDRNLEQVARTVADRGVAEVSFSPAVVSYLRQEVADVRRLAFGGRAVNTVTESEIINPLARELLDAPELDHVVVEDVVHDHEGARLRLRARRAIEG
jgi:ATP-dependent Clp protease ATP-binding subunit ClpB